MMAARSRVEQRGRFTWKKDGRDNGDVRYVSAARVRRIEYKRITRLHLSGALLKNHANAFAHRTQVHRHVWRIGDEIAKRIKDRAREVEPLFDVDRIARVRERDAHLFGNRHEQVVEHFEQYRVGGGAYGVGALSPLCALQHKMIV